METEKAIEKLKNPKKIDLISIIRQFKREGIENFVITRPEIIETILQQYRKQEKMIDLMVNHFYHIIDNDDNASLFPYEVYLGYDNIEERIKQYFENKVNEEAE